MRSFVELDARAMHSEDLVGECRNVGVGQIFFAKLNEVDAIGDPAAGLTEESGLLLGFIA